MTGTHVILKYSCGESESVAVTVYTVLPVLVLDDITVLVADMIFLFTLVLQLHLRGIYY